MKLKPKEKAKPKTKSCDSLALKCRLCTSEPCDLLLAVVLCVGMVTMPSLHVFAWLVDLRSFQRYI